MAVVIAHVTIGQDLDRFSYKLNGLTRLSIENCMRQT